MINNLDGLLTGNMFCGMFAVAVCYRWRLNFCPDTWTLVEFYKNVIAELGKPKKSLENISSLGENFVELCLL